MNATNSHKAAMALLRHAHAMEGQVRKEWFVYGDVWYDQVPLAISLGLQKYRAKHLLLVYAYLEFMFFAGTLAIESTGLATLEKDAKGYVCSLTPTGRTHAAELEKMGWRW